MIVAVSDSHIPGRAEKIPEKFLNKVENADLVAHAGDFVTKDVYDMIEGKADDFYAVKGNCDKFDLPNSETFEVDGVSVGVYHGTGINPRGHHPTLVKIANDLDVDVLIHGHTHQQEAVKKQDKVLLNPGSSTGVGGGSSDRGNPKMMEIEIDGDRLDASLIELDDGVKKIEESFEL